MNKQLKIELKLDDKASDGLKKFTNNTKNLKKDLEVLGNTFVGLGGLATGTLAGITKASIDFESSFAGIRKTVNGTEDDFKALEKNIRDIAKSAPKSVNELNAIGEVAGQLGVSGVKDLTKFIDTVSKITETTNLTAESASMDFAQISNIMEEPINNIDRMASSVVDLGNNFATTERDIVNFASRIAGAGKIAGITSADIFGISSAFTSVGVEAEAGGTAVQKVLLSMNTSVATSDEYLSTFAKTTGMTIAEFRETEPVERFTKFVEGLNTAGDDAILILEELGLKDQRLIRAFLSLANAGDVLERSVKKSNEAFEENTALTIEAEKRYATTESQLRILRNNFNDIGITIGASVLPALNSFLTTLKPVIEETSNFAQEHPTLIARLLGLTATIGGTVIAYRTLSGPVIAITNFIRALSTITINATTVWALFSLAGVKLIGVLAGIKAGLALLSIPIALVMAGIAGLDFGTGGLVTRLNNLRIGLNQVKTATNEYEQASESLRQSMDRKAQAGRNLERATINYDYAVINLKKSAENLLEVEKQYGKDSVEFEEAKIRQRDAELQLKEAKDNVTQAIQENTEAQEDHREKTDTWIEKNKELQDNINETGTAWNSLSDAVRNAISWVQKFFGMDTDGGKVSVNIKTPQIKPYSGADIFKQQSTQYRRNGGIIGGGYNDEIPTILHGGERVVPRTGADVNESERPITINFNAPIGIRNDNDITKIANEVKNMISRENLLYSQGLL